MEGRLFPSVFGRSNLHAFVMAIAEMWSGFNRIISSRSMTGCDRKTGAAAGLRRGHRPRPLYVLQLCYAFALASSLRRRSRSATCMFCNSSKVANSRFASPA
jgi:hypothetical protein